MGSVYRRGKIYWIKYHRKGKQHFESSKSDKIEIAKRLLKLREGEIAQGKLPSSCFDKVKFDELADELLTDYRINGRKSLPRTERSVNHLKELFEGMKVTEITTPLIKEYVALRLDEKAANATINRELAALKRMLHLGAQQTPTKVGTVPYIPMLRENNVRKGFFEHGEFIALRNALPLYLQGFVTFGYKTGWRFSEIRNLKWTEVDLRKGEVRLEPGETKNNEGRTIYLDDDLQEILKQQLSMMKRNNRMSVYVFPNKTYEGRISEIRKSWSKACKDAGIGAMLFHDLRRTAVRNMIRAGIPERVAMMISGHKTRSVFDRYNIVSQEDLKEAARKVRNYEAKQNEALQFSYNPGAKGKRVTTMKAVTP